MRERGWAWGEGVDDEGVGGEELSLVAHDGERGGVLFDKRTLADSTFQVQGKRVWVGR